MASHRVVSRQAPLHIVFNLGSGKQNGEDVRENLIRALGRAGRSFRIYPVDGGESLDMAVREAGAAAQAQQGVLVAAGGDGTIHAVAQEAVRAGLTLGVLPQGTFNYFGRRHGLSSQWSEALSVLLSGQAYPVQVGQINDRVFLVNASLGLYPQLLQDREAYKQQFGRSRGVALWAGLMTLLREHRLWRLEIEHRDRRQTLRTPTLFVGNNRLQLEQVGIAEAPALDNGQLAVLVLKPVGTVKLLGLLWRGALGQLGDADSVDSFACRRLVVRPSLPLGVRRVKIACDGEITWAVAPLVFSVAPQPLWLVKAGPHAGAATPQDEA